MIAQLQTPFDLTQPAGQVLAVVFFLIPGLNVTWIVERLRGRSTLASTERLLRAIAWSVLIYASASPWLLRIGRRLVTGRHLWPWEPIIGAALIIFVAPVALASVIAAIRRPGRIRELIRRFTRIHPAPTAWDFAFTGEGPSFVRLKLRGGERVGGIFGERSFASAYPERNDLFLEQVWSLDPEGSFVEPSPDSQGILLDRADIETLELLSPRVEGANTHGQDR